MAAPPMAVPPVEAPAAPPAPLRGEPLSTEDVGGVVGAAMSGAMTLQMIFIGDALGLYCALKQSGGPVTSAELAARLGLNERWVREWLYQQASARLVECDAGAGRFWTTKAQQDVLANEDGPDASPFFAGGTAAGIFHITDHRDWLLKCFKTGDGLPYDAHGVGCATGVKRELGVWTRHFLLERVSSLPGLRPRLEAGAKVADVGCGAGLAVCLLATAFPKSEFLGYDVSHNALDLAVEDAKARALGNARFFNCNLPDGSLPGDASLDFVYVLDALHDMAHPDEVLAAIRKSLKPDGLFLICDINSRGGPPANIASHPMAPLMYGFSVSVCMGSGLSAPNGMGLGTLGFPKEVAERMVLEAGFSSLEVLDWQSHMNAYYLVRP